MRWVHCPCHLFELHGDARLLFLFAAVAWRSQRVVASGGHCRQRPLSPEDHPSDTHRTFHSRLRF
jgi:hypothetical protein